MLDEMLKLGGATRQALIVDAAGRAELAPMVVLPDGQVYCPAVYAPPPGAKKKARANKKQP